MLLCLCFALPIPPGFLPFPPPSWCRAHEALTRQPRFNTFSGLSRRFTPPVFVGPGSIAGGLQTSSRFAASFCPRLSIISIAGVLAKPPRRSRVSAVLGNTKQLPRLRPFSTFSMSPRQPKFKGFQEAFFIPPPDQAPPPRQQASLRHDLLPSRRKFRLALAWCTFSKSNSNVIATIEAFSCLCPSKSSHKTGRFPGDLSKGVSVPNLLF